jgi:hypothetical protein
MRNRQGSHRSRYVKPLPTTVELICPCGITFEPLPWFNENLDGPVCDECADHATGKPGTLAITAGAMLFPTNLAIL